MAYDFLENGLFHLGIEPFAEILLEGKAQTFVSRIHNMAAYIAYANRKKVVNSLLIVINSMKRMLGARQDVGETYFTNCTKIQDMYIELLNSLVRNLVNLSEDTTVQDISDAAMLMAIKRKLKKDRTTEQNRTGKIDSTSSKGQGEIVREEKMQRKRKDPSG